MNYFTKTNNLSQQADSQQAYSTANKSEFNRSGKNQPCPVCDRTKDGDCRFNDDKSFVLCHSDPDGSNGHRNRGYTYKGKTNDGIWGQYAKQSKSHPKSDEIEAEYKYRDENGNIVVTVQRLANKKGFPVKPSKVKDVPLYNWPEVLKATKNGEYIFFCEGEKDADSLIQLGLVATTTIGGSKGINRSQKYLNQLSKLNPTIIIVPDRDKPGLEYSGKLEKLFTFTNFVYADPTNTEWDNPPEKSGFDISDWIAQGTTKEDILKAITHNKYPTKSEIETDLDVDKLPKCIKNKRKIEQTWGNRLRFNTYSKEIELDGKPITGTEFDTIYLRIGEELQLNVPKNQGCDIILSIAKKNEYNPVVEYLNSCFHCHGENNHILDKAAEKYLGTTDDLASIYLKKWFISAVARALNPGCKADNALILQGDQGIGKSSFFSILAGEGLFDDSLGDARDKDEKMKLHCSWICEWAELEAVFKKKDVATVKAFLSAQEDKIRPPYGRAVETLKRHSVIVGTTNEETFLSDSTGSRRFWIIRVPETIDLEALKCDRNQLWAAAVASYRAGNQWWLSETEQAKSNSQNEEFQTKDPWENTIANFCDKGRLDFVTSDELLNELEIPISSQNKASQQRIGSIMRSLGWKRDRKTHKGGRKWGYTRPIEACPTGRIGEDVGRPGSAEFVTIQEESIDPNDQTTVDCNPNWQPQSRQPPYFAPVDPTKIPNPDQDPTGNPVTEWVNRLTVAVTTGNTAEVNEAIPPELRKAVQGAVTPQLREQIKSQVLGDVA